MIASSAKNQYRKVKIKAPKFAQKHLIFLFLLILKLEKLEKKTWANKSAQKALTTHIHKENLGKKHFSEDTEKQPKSKSVDKFGGGGGGFQHLAQTEERKKERKTQIIQSTSADQKRKKKEANRIEPNHRNRIELIKLIRPAVLLRC